jgi:SWI/SNF-related matrix-associated actin-dependent regulator of chromatin subfamily A-like protein 1
MVMDLFPYQQDAIDRIINTSNVGSYLGFDMGLGKSAVALETAKKRNVSRLMILCPAVGRLSWVKECARWWPGKPVLVVSKPGDLTVPRPENVILIVAYSSLSMSKSGGFDYVAALKQWGAFDMTVIDEAHNLKNPGAIRTKAVLIDLKPILGWCLPMSGTPVPNHPGELFPILRVLFPDTIRKPDGKVMKQYEFEEAYCDIDMRWFNGREVRQIKGGKNLDMLKKRLAPYMIRLTKKQALPQLPDMSFDTYPVSAPNAPLWNIDTGRFTDDAFLSLLRDNPQLMRLRRMLGEAKVRGSVEAVSDMLENCKRKVLVFAHHTSVIDGLIQGLLEYGVVSITGSTSAGLRTQAIDAFLNNPNIRVFVGNIQAAGTSITLVGPSAEVSDVFFVEADWSPGNNVQAASRIHRIGQKDAVQVWFITAHGTYDDRIQDILTRKAADFHKLFG